MKILHITDSHGTAKSPEGRKDIYYIAFLRKLYELGYVIKKAGIDVVLHTGDLFHSSRVSDKFAGQVASMIKSWGVPVYVVPGNHDIEGYTIDTIDNTKLGLLAKAGVIKILDRENSVVLNCSSDNGNFTVRLSGQEYYADIDTRNKNDFMMQEDLCDFNILGYHGTLVNRKLHPSMRFTLASDVITDADAILCGHLHEKYWFNIGQDTSVYNPGSMMRLDRSEYNKTHMPQYGIMNIELDDDGSIVSEYDFYQFKTARPAEEVLDYETASFDKAKVITLENFKASLDASANNIKMDTNVADMIDVVGSNDEDVKNAALVFYNNAFNAMPTEFEVKQGYIESPITKYITSVEIKNFQSHENTKVDFTNGLNVIVGESNNGKTSILRAILWAVDNVPLGTDFIMAGKNDCSVTIYYSDGSYIRRTRTVKSTGTYECGYIDEHGNFVEPSYSGFTNAVPVEIDNIHQMPKVSITKDIETHLNVMSQLEGPFLITDSPQNRASAIGRLTGVHIADAAINLVNTQMRADNADIKSATTEISELDFALSNLPNNATVDELENLVNNISAYADKLSADIDGIQKRRVYVYQKQQEIDAKKTEQEHLKPFIGLKSECDNVNKFSASISNLYKSMKKFADTTVKLSPLKTNLNELYKYTEIKCCINSSMIQKISEMKRIFVLLENTREQAEKVAEKFNIATVLGKLYNASAINLDYGWKLIESVDKLDKQIGINNACVKDIENKMTEKQTLDGEIDAMNVQSDMINADMNKAIQDNGICPCCGRKITKESVEHVKQYLTK